MGDEPNRRLVAEWISADPIRWGLLDLVRSLELPHAYLAAGFVRNAVWARLHGLPATISGDVDLIWFDADHCGEEHDRAFEKRLRRAAPAINWSVKNQARMHLRNGDRPYASIADAMRHWPETATAIAIRRTGDDDCEIIAPFGLDDLFALRLRPAGAFSSSKRPIFDARVHSKGWLNAFPKLQVVD